MHGAEVLIPILIPLGAFAMVFAIFYLKTKENLAMVEKGINPKESTNRPAPFKSLKWGLLLAGAGLGLFIAYMLDKFAMQSANQFDHNDNPALYFSLIGLGGGLGLVLSYFIEKKHWLDKSDTNGE
jgi:hypothetical protein